MAGETERARDGLTIATDRQISDAVARMVQEARSAGAAVRLLSFQPFEGGYTASVETSPPVEIEPFSYLIKGARTLTPEERAERRRLWNDPEERARIRALPPISRGEVLRALHNRMRNRAKPTTPGPFPSRKRFKHTFGYTLEQLRAHLQRGFSDGMSWGNMEYWHIDHVRPLASFAIAGVRCDQFREAWSLANLQPLWGRDNISKGARWTP